MRTRVVLASLVCAVVAAGVAVADDFSEVHADYEPDGQVTPCRFSKTQLQSAKQQAQSYPDGTYTGFIAELDQEIARWDSGGCSGVAPPPGSTDPGADFSAVFSDWRPDGMVTRCKFTRHQLVNALNEAAKNTDIDAYAPGFRDAVRAEIAAWDARKCAEVKVGNLEILRVKAKGRKGKPRNEFVTIKNASIFDLPLRFFRLQDRANSRLRLPKKYTLKKGRKLRVVTGCLGKRKKPTRRQGRFYACKKKGQVWNDKGDVVKIVTTAGLVVAQRGFGRFKAVPRF